jgi:hypothetical protein
MSGQRCVLLRCRQQAGGRHLECIRNLHEPRAADPVAPFSYFWICWNVMPQATVKSVWLTLAARRATRIFSRMTVSSSIGLRFVMGGD